MNVGLMTSHLVMSTVLRNSKNANEEIKCNKCAEKVNCVACANGGKPNCPQFSSIGKG